MAGTSVTGTRDRLLTVEEAAEFLGVKVRMIRSLIETRRVKFVKVGRLVRLRESDLSEAVEAWTVSPVRSPGRWR